VVIGAREPESLRGAPSVAVLETIDDYGLGARRDAAYERALGALHRPGTPRPSLDEAVARAGREALAALDRIAAAKSSSRAPRAGYGDDAFSRSLGELARLLHAGVGVEVACLDLDGWDTHFLQGAAIAERAAVLARGLAAFREDLGDEIGRVTLVVLTEFGRRAYENGSYGTDHGRASAAFLLGGGVAGGRVVTSWPGLLAHELEEPGDLRVSIDYRDVLAELCEHRLGNSALGEVFPGFLPTPRGLVTA
jgi:uncharacterized protein (DUF1501 family)